MDVESGDKAINLPNFCHSFSPTHLLYHLITFFLTFLYVICTFYRSHSGRVTKILWTRPCTKNQQKKALNQSQEAGGFWPCFGIWKQASYGGPVYRGLLFCLDTQSYYRATLIRKGEVCVWGGVGLQNFKGMGHKKELKYFYKNGWF